jgi:chromosomal replication initiation ATPase DnaA
MLPSLHVNGYEWDYRGTTSAHRERILHAVCHHFKVRHEELQSQHGNRRITDAKKALAWLLRKKGDTYHRIALEMNRTHGTVIWLEKQAEALLSSKSERQFKNNIELILNNLI